MLAARLGIEALVDEAVDLGDRPGAANAGAKVMTLVAAMALGADSIDDCDILRAGRTAAVLGHRVAAPSTLGTFLRAFTFGHVRQLDRVLGEALERAWRAGAGPGSQRLVVDVDSFVGEVHGYQKQGACFGYTRERGYHPLLASRADTGEVLHVRLRKGSANTARGALRFVEELIPGWSARAPQREAAARRLGLLVEQDLRPPRAGGLELLDRRAPAAARARGDRGDPRAGLADARRLPAHERGADRRDRARGQAPDRAQGAHARRPGRAAAELGALSVRDEPRGECPRICVGMSELERHVYETTQDRVG
jgi:Transposase DDE domain group 1